MSSEIEEVEVLGVWEERHTWAGQEEGGASCWLLEKNLAGKRKEQTIRMHTNWDSWTLLCRRSRGPERRIYFKMRPSGKLLSGVRGCLPKPAKTKPWLAAGGKRSALLWFRIADAGTTGTYKDEKCPKKQNKQKKSHWLYKMAQFNVTNCDCVTLMWEPQEVRDEEEWAG